MHIGIEAERANNPQKTGVEHYAKQLILHLAEIDRENRYILYLRTQPEAWLLNLPENFKLKVMPFQIFWTQLRVSWEMLFNPVDILMVPASALPIVHPKKSVVTIHDIGWRYFPQSFTWFMRNFLEWSTAFAVKRASKIIAVSESTKRDIVKFYGVSGEKIVVVHHGYDTQVQNPKSLPRSQAGEIRKNSNIEIPNKYVLFLSTLQPRKNLGNLIDAFRLLKKEFPDLPHKLVVVGRMGWKFEKILKKLEDNRDIVVYLNYLSDEGRRQALLGAELLVQPAFYEGFGMQALEALAAGIPLACSKVSSLPEVAGDAAVYFDPHNPTDIKNAIKAVLFDKSLAESLVSKGRERVKLFGWEKCAKETLKVLLETS